MHADRIAVRSEQRPVASTSRSTGTAATGTACSAAVGAAGGKGTKENQEWSTKD
jgi:hypothetical protein